MALMELEFEDAGSSGLYIDLPGNDAEAVADLSAGVVRALTHDNQGGVQKNFAAYYAIHFDTPIDSCEVQALDGRRVAVVRLQADGPSKKRPSALEHPSSPLIYSPDNFAGDEDTGATSTWYILSALGLFALYPGKPEWSLAW
jgi:hypothetical protein